MHEESFTIELLVAFCAMEWNDKKKVMERRNLILMLVLASSVNIKFDAKRKAAILQP